MSGEIDTYVGKHLAGDDQLRRDLSIVHRMPPAFRVLARDLLRALNDDPAATRVVARVLIGYSREHLERQGDEAPKVN